jgi:tRNA pseudouridine38-40 synthase
VKPGDFPPRRLAFKVEYDGTDFHGWQFQPDTDATIQGELQRAIKAFLGLEAQVDGASRTDAGVHAQDQLAACTVAHPVGVSGFPKGVNRRLPNSIAISSAFEVPLDFAPRFANEGKVYCYRLYQSRDRRPILDRFAWRIPWNLDRGAMEQAAGQLIGEHDFTSFAASDGGHKSAIRSLESIKILDETDEMLILRFQGRGFLKQMVRNLVGTLVDVGRGHREPMSTQEILEARDRSQAGPTAPANGLTLEKMILREET